jgi:transcriptional regulator with XRE-family HTH domain
VEKNDSGIDIQGFLLKIYRKGKGLTQAEVARRSGLGRSTISMFESGKREGEEKSLTALLKVYGLTIKKFERKVLKFIFGLESFSPYSDSSENIEHEWLKLNLHNEDQKDETINNFLLRRHIQKNYGYEALFELNKIVAEYYEAQRKNRRLNHLRKKKLPSFVQKRGLILSLSPRTTMELSNELKKNYAERDSTDRYFKRTTQLFYYFIYKTLNSYCVKGDLFQDTIRIVKSLVKQNSVVFSKQLLLSNEMADEIIPDAEYLKNELYKYVKKSIPKTKNYINQYPVEYRDNFRKILNANIIKSAR